jgi:hypothetical protein
LGEFQTPEGLAGRGGQFYEYIRGCCYSEGLLKTAEFTYECGVLQGEYQESFILKVEVAGVRNSWI